VRFITPTLLVPFARTPQSISLHSSLECSVGRDPAATRRRRRRPYSREAAVSKADGRFVACCAL